MADRLARLVAGLSPEPEADWQTQRLAQGLPGPRQGKLTPENEQGFQAFMAFDPNVRAWRNTYRNQLGEMPDTDNPAYDYRKAYTAGAVPQPYEADGGLYHWDSRGKAPDHPTAWMQDFMDRGWGDVNDAAQQGLTPDQSSMVNQQLHSDLMKLLAQRYL